MILLCRCAAEIALGVLPGPYSDDDTRAYARATPIPCEVLERPAPAGDARLAHGLGVPSTLHTARQDHARNPTSVGGSA